MYQQSIPIQSDDVQSDGAQSDGDRENPKRADVMLLCEIRQGARPWKMARLEDISQHGFRIAWLPDSAVNDVLRIRIPGLEPLRATVRWQKGKQVGCQFAEPLHIAVFDHILGQI